MGDNQVETLRLGTSNRRLDAAAIQQGLKKECPFRPGFTVLLLPAATYNPRYRKALQNARAAEAAKTEQEADADLRNRYEDPEFVIEAFVAGMGGIYDQAGAEVPYTPELGLQLLADLANADVKEWIATEAHQYGQFYTGAVEADAGN